MAAIGAIILAAGGATRFGKPKQLLEFCGKTIIDHVLDSVRDAGVAHSLVVTGAYHHQLEDALSDSSDLVYNAQWQQGMGASIALGVDTIRCNLDQLTGILVLLADQPLVTTTHISRLLQRLETENCIAVASEYNNGAGVPAVFSPALFDRLSTLRGDHGARQLLHDGLGEVCTVFPDFPLLDVDTPQDYKDLLSISGNS